ncbi:uncharacterized protein EDB91DRAFT_1247683 [Suillus paluster]|uniref:uncharacterized protein n=1 Tax=Suillus paluster TaxID=48578 RepID=UPI001B86540E|nr:uncharacterized protein EDB91DRAFT_1258820 [Suillus paluster]XP_041177922.1 uncharacterized protein EDB91DRAFT_1247683 [Suillus paluster]KAG1718174.1 hypothetical protein EDB91DRAFT_1258820 [Suillus paluster]KAG1742282.1 hypothetical protein EDB91DRAFT_1247683 [Suillus paluster]
MEVEKVVEEEVLNLQDKNTPVNQNQTSKTKKRDKMPHNDAIDAIHNASHQDSHTAHALDTDKKGNLLKIFLPPGGITSASIRMITSLVTSDKAYATEDECRQLGEFWLWFQDFTGIWKSPFILQKSMAHLHYILDTIKIPALDSNNFCPSVALALAAVVVKCAFTLLAENSITFEVVEPSEKGKKKAIDPQENGKASVYEAFSKEH